MSGKSLFITSVAVVVVWAAIAQARTIRIRADYGTIQEGIDAAVSGDTVLLADGTYDVGCVYDQPTPFARDYGLVLEAKNIVLTSEHGPNFTRIYGHFGDLGCEGWGINILGPVDTSCVISGIDFFACSAWPSQPYISLAGAGIRLQNASPSIGNCKFTAGGSAEGGGGILCLQNSNPTIWGCTFEGISSGGNRTGTRPFGGTILADSSSLRIYKCTFRNNLSSNGAAIRGQHCSGEIVDCIFEINISKKLSGTAPSLAEGSGGAIQLEGSSVTIRRCTFRANKAIFTEPDFYGDSLIGGGAVAILSGSAVSLQQCTFVNNYCAEERYTGTGYTYSQPFYDYGQQVLVQSSQSGLDRTIVAFSPWLTAVMSDSSDVTYILCTDIYGHPGGDWTGPLAPLLTGNGNLHSDPHFCDTTTHQFYLASNSPGAPSNNSCNQLLGAWNVEDSCTVSCCEGWAGNVSGDPEDAVDIADLTALIDNLFVTFTPLVCEGEANCSAAPGIDISDLTALIDNLFVTFTPLPGCAN